jgi:hypothetical protein
MQAEIEAIAGAKDKVAPVNVALLESEKTEQLINWLSDI